VFAPNNAAFAALGADAFNSLTADTPLLTNLLKKHVLGSVVPAAAALKLRDASVKTLAGEAITVDSDGKKVMVTPTIVGGVSTVTIPDVQACNGVVHVVDEVIALDALVEEESEEESCKTIAELATGTYALTTLVAAIKVADPAVLNLLSDKSATLTVFAPNNAAFAALGADAFNSLTADTPLLTNLLKKHVLGSVVPAAAALKLRDASVKTLAGEAITVNSDGKRVMVFPTLEGGVAKVVVADVQACNGVVHIIDEVIALDELVEDKEPECKTIAQLATETDSLSTLLTAVKKADAGVLKLLSDPDATLTVFAPDNDAFAALGADALNEVLADQSLLTNLLKKHVLGSVVPASAALKLRDASVETLAGQDIVVSSGRKVFVEPTIVGGPATVIKPDVEACNGVVHVIDEVLALDEEKETCGFDGYVLKSKTKGAKFKRVEDPCECEEKCGEKKRDAESRNLWTMKKKSGKCLCYGEPKRGNIRVKKSKKAVSSHDE